MCIVYETLVQFTDTSKRFFLESTFAHVLPNLELDFQFQVYQLVSRVPVLNCICESQPQHLRIF